MSGRSSFVTEPPFASARVVQHCINLPSLFLSIANRELSNHGLSSASQATKSLQSGFSPCRSITSPAGDPNRWDSFPVWILSSGIASTPVRVPALDSRLPWTVRRTICDGRYDQHNTLHQLFAPTHSQTVVCMRFDRQQRIL